MSTATENADKLKHVAWLYPDADALFQRSKDFVQEGLDRGEPVLVAQPKPQLDRLAAVFGDNPTTTFIDMTVAGRNPGRILPWVLHRFAVQHAGRRVRIIGEPIWSSRTGQVYTACVQHEALINVALEGLDVTIACPYDATLLSAQALHDAHRTHPLIEDDARATRVSDLYHRDELDKLGTDPLPPPVPHASSTLFAADTLRHLRGMTATQALGAGMPKERVQALQMAVNEAATNAIQHGSSTGTFTVWHDEQHLICEVQSSVALPDLLAGRRQPPAGSGAGRGLPLIHYLCDLVRVQTGPEGTTVRMWMSVA